MPVICINPTNEIEAEIINKLSLQNQDLRLFVSNKNEENYINKLKERKKLLVTLLMILIYLLHVEELSAGSSLKITKEIYL